MKNKGKKLVFIKEFEKALKSFDEAITLNENYVKAYYKRMQICIELRKFKGICNNLTEIYDKAFFILGDKINFLNSLS